MRGRFIFLDIDGVMKPARAYFCKKNAAKFDAGFDPLAIAAINRLCKHAGASVVFNTTWNRQDIAGIAKAEGLTAPVAGKTKYPFVSDRLTAIRQWLAENGQEESRWIALDDCKIDHEQAVHVCPENGISIQNYRDACHLLGKSDAFMVLL